MLSSFIWGAPEEGPLDPPVPEGHRGIDVLIEGQVIRVDVDALAEVSGLFLQVQSTDACSCPLEDFPGGVPIFRQIVHLKTKKPQEGKPPQQLEVDEDNVLSLLEAAYLLECPQVFEDVMETPYMQSLSSRQAVELLEHILPFTLVSSPIDGAATCHDFAAQSRSPKNSDLLAQGSNGARPLSKGDDFLRTFQMETKVWQTIERAALDLVKQLDTSDFVLGPRLATGSLRVCRELLEQFRRREEELGYVSSALQPMSTLWKNFVDKPLRAEVAWDPHLFALQCMRKRLHLEDFEADDESAVKGEHEEDDEARNDLPGLAEICEATADSTLLDMVDLVRYVDLRSAPPTWTALLVRMLVCGGQLAKAQAAFVEAFPTSLALQHLAWQRPAVVPPLWLSAVAEHSEASQVLLRVLVRFREMGGEELCKILEDVLLDSFIPTQHGAKTVLASSLMNEIVGALFDAGRKARTGRGSAPSGDGGSGGGRPAPELRERCPKHWAGAHVLWRLQHVGTRLFAAAFVPQQGFLPHRWPVDVLDGDPAARSRGDEFAKIPAAPGLDHDRVVNAADVEEALCLAEPIVVRVAGHCLWDEDLLDLGLLQATMDAGRATPNEPILHYGRQVIMRHLWYRHRGAYCEVPQLRDLWDLACWPLCKDPGLIRQALEYLKGTCRELQAQGGAWLPEHEETLFQMFVALDLSLLPGQALLSPWVPAQVHVVRLLVEGQTGEQCHNELQLAVTSAADDLKSIHQQWLKLSNRLNIVEQRTVINKSQINDAISAIEEHQRKKREPAPGARRIGGLPLPAAQAA